MPVQMVTDEELLAAFGEIPGPIVTTPDLAEIIDMKRDGIRKRLIQLEEQGLVKSKKVGARSVVWWRIN